MKTRGLKSMKLFWLICLLLAIIIKLFAQNRAWVEAFYSKKIYHTISILLRCFFGWIPFSIGDVLYFAAGLWLFVKIIKNTLLFFKRRFTKTIFFSKLWKLFLLFISIYIVFNIFWGLNYNRKEVGTNLNLPQIKYDTNSIILLQDILLKKVNENKQYLLNRNTGYPSNNDLFCRAEICYDNAAKMYSFIQYQKHSVKSSLYGSLGNYLGFTGYYNPFSGEAQVNTTVPKFLLPYITTHEIAHQLGFAKEDEANFVGYLAAVNSGDTLFSYSAYLDLFIYANREVYYFDSLLSKNAATKLIPEVKADLAEWRQFNEAHTSFMEPAITWLYGKYLQINQQPEGMRSYNEVIAMLMAYYKKFGRI